MGNTLLKKANDVALALNVSQFFCCDVRTVDHLNRDGPKVAKYSGASRRVEHFSYVLANLQVSIRLTLNAIDSDINPLGQPSVLVVAAPFAALLQLFVYAALHHESSSLEHQTSWLGEPQSFRCR